MGIVLNINTLENCLKSYGDIKIIDLLIKILKHKMYSNIEKYGLNDVRTIKVSQELDRLIVQDMKQKKEFPKEPK
ncbi:spo0E like sporulation regulatory family protein [Clostridium argentinense CDC 2741]|uniref:Spo0E like sporulation regulatory family protein n=1 Tax=Clostridium argentinense CDC 2741 TaxID=1418104 RepID=A0A0C1R8Q9_9CLOT|nr:aspartyl-phosphate phosphatase Spo0E family protein [Clostridium argentinense]ARC85667.1 aspartyl-phosphate phosphatase Spo0E family protein [Clostridium argentinense]KIE46906.1 spo0E like sporulation regulatory family protein [Clostridium argentinense CDC 2741]